MSFAGRAISDLLVPHLRYGKVNGVINQMFAESRSQAFAKTSCTLAPFVRNVSRLFYGCPSPGPQYSEWTECILYILLYRMRLITLGRLRCNAG